jgi:flagellar M-ring protein FliF
MVRYGMVALGALFAWLLVLRPLMRMLNQRVAPQGAAAAAAPNLATVQAGASNALPGAHSAGALPAPAAGALAAEQAATSTSGTLPVQALLEEYDLPPAGSAVDVMVDHLKVLAGKEPERVAEVVKQWVQKKNGGSEQ